MIYFFLSLKGMLTFQSSWIVEISNLNSHRSILKSSHLHCFQPDTCPNQISVLLGETGGSYKCVLV